MSERSVCWRGSAVREPPVRQSEALVQLAIDLFDRKGAHPRRRQLDGQRNPVQPIANGSERGGVLVVTVKVRAGEQGTVGEQLHGLEWRDGFRRVRLLRIGQRQRRHSVSPARHRCRALPGCSRESVTCWTLTQRARRPACAQPSSRCSQLSSSSSSLLSLRYSVSVWAMVLPGCFLQAQHRRHRLWHETRVRERREFHEPDAVGEALERVGGNLQAETRLAAATRSR